ncbi:4-hydroxy-tetrahydrodipicolinate reductase [Bdellovibrionota bacterium]
MTKVGIYGFGGRMGQRIAALLQNNNTPGELAAAVDTNPKFVGKDMGIKVRSNPEEIFNDVDVIIDFSSPQATLELVQKNREIKKPLVIGTTGFSESQKKELLQIVEGTPVVIAPNMSLGVNLLAGLVKKTAETLTDGFSVNIIEAHHIHKKDSPSGTALFLEKAVGEGNEIHKGKIEIEAIREGEIVGEHSVFFDGPGEQIELTHTAKSRDTFALGSIKAATWLVNQPPGLYDMFDVLGLKE